MYLFQEELAALRREDLLREARKRAQVAEARRARRSHRRGRRGPRLSTAFAWARPLSVALRGVFASERGTLHADQDCERSAG